MNLIIFVFLGLAATTKMLWFWHIGKPEGSTINSATGFTQAKVRLLDSGHTAGTFLTDEFGYQVAANKLMRLRTVMVLLTFMLPYVLVASDLILYATVSCLIGLLLERWLFFAEARHVVRLYHGEQST